MLELKEYKITLPAHKIRNYYIVEHTLYIDVQNLRYDYLMHFFASF